MRSLEIRDLEILRALVRVRYLTSRQLITTFFSCPRVGRRRVHRLSELDLIRPHTKGVSELLRYSAWRITSRGLDEVAHALPDESIPDGLLDRVANGSLHHIQHREAIADLYLKLVVPDRSQLAEADRAAQRRWAAEMRGRAAALTWQPDGDVVLKSDYLGERVDVVPDAVVRSDKAKTRVFVELDRSTKDLGRILDCLKRYARVLRNVHLGEDTPLVLFVVRSAARQANIRALVGQILDPPKTIVALDVEAVEWLRTELLSLPADPPRQSPVFLAAKRAYLFMRKLDDTLRQNGMRKTLDEQQPTLMKDGYTHLLALYNSLRAEP